MKKFIFILSLLCFSINMIGQSFPFSIETNSSGFPYASTKSNNPIKVIECNGEDIVSGDILLVKMASSMGISLSYSDTSDENNKVDKIIKMEKKGKIAITLSNNEVLDGQYHQIIESDYIFSRVSILSSTIAFKSSLKDLTNLSVKEVDQYICNQLSTYDIKRVQIGDVIFNYLTTPEALLHDWDAFPTAATIKAMIQQLTAL